MTQKNPCQIVTDLCSIFCRASYLLLLLLFYCKRTNFTQRVLHVTMSPRHPPLRRDKLICNTPDFVLRSFLSDLSDAEHPRQFLPKVAEQNNDLFMASVIHTSHPSQSNVQPVAFHIRYCLCPCHRYCITLVLHKCLFQCRQKHT